MTASTSRFAPAVVTDYLKDAPKPQVDWYLGTGEPQCLEGQFLIRGDFVTKLFPGLRGIKVGDEVATIDEAIAKATEVRATIREREQEPFDLAAAGIDDEARDLQQDADEALMRIETIVHIGTMQDGHLADPLQEMLEDLEADGTDPVLDQLPFLRKILADIDCGVEDVVQEMRDRGTVGFLIQASVPGMTRRDDGSASIHYGIRTLRIFYGSTFGVACRAALDWAGTMTQTKQDAA